MIEFGCSFTYADAQWQQIREVVQRGLNRDADGIPDQRRPVVSWGMLRNRIEDEAAFHLVRSAVARETPARKARIKQLTELDKLADALRDAINAAYKTFILKGRLGQDNPEFSVIPADTSPPPPPARGRSGPNVDRDLIDIAKLKATIAREIAALKQTPAAVNASKAYRDQLWNDMVSIWTDIGGKPTGMAAARFLMAVSEPVFDRVRAEGGSRTAASMPTKRSIEEWLRLRSIRNPETRG
jgi:hypothetical protein